ncbi:MAG: hypothetical protein GC185_01565 [Alphaproteobacteria bacterium]|nr:hypothetical protein [Alphaproteobacteria bacterium]
MTLYALCGFLCLVTALKIVAPLLDRGRFRHGAGVTGADRRLAAVLFCLVPVFALSLYLSLGRPELPSRFALFHDVTALMDRQDDLLAEEPLRVLLEENPEDLGALLQMAGLNARLGRDARAVVFYEHAVRIAAAQDNILLEQYMQSLGRTQVDAAHGTVDAAAMRTFDAILKRRPEDPIALYYAALFKAQHGDEQGAIADWTKMLSTGTPLVYWKWNVRAAIAAARAHLSKAKNNQDKK